MGYLEYANAELLKSNLDKLIQKNILELLEILSNQGHSGLSISYVINYFKKFALLKSMKDVELEFIKIGYEPIDKCEDGPDRWIQENIIELLNTFFNQKHSDIDSEIIYFTKLAKFEPIAPILCTDDEWTEVGENEFQNKRCGGVFKKGKDGKPYYLDAIIWTHKKTGVSYSGSALNSKNERISSRQYIKLPFYPKSFYIDRVDIYYSDDDYESYIENESQLKEVWEYYERQETPSYIRVKKLEKINNK
jgi:hypothetical protein